jgi:hypothetical protein
MELINNCNKDTQTFMTSINDVVWSMLYFPSVCIGGQPFVFDNTKSPFDIKYTVNALLQYTLACKKCKFQSEYASTFEK